MEAHDGTLTVRSELKRGSTFTALIPLKAKAKVAKTEVIGGPEKPIDSMFESGNDAKATKPLTRTRSGRLIRNDTGPSPKSPPSRSSSIRQVLLRPLLRIRPTMHCSNRPCIGCGEPS